MYDNIADMDPQVGELLKYLPVDSRWDPYRDDPRSKSLLDWCGFMRAPR